MYRITTPSFETPQEESPIHAPIEFIVPVATHVIINSQIHYHAIYYLKATEIGIPISAIHCALVMSKFCDQATHITITNGVNTVDWEITAEEAYIIPAHWVDGTQYIEVKLQLISDNKFEHEEVQDSTLESVQTIGEDFKSRRSRERTISEVSNKVIEWKKICLKLKEEVPIVKKVSERAAELIGIPKKSLDDYMHQIKLGRKYHFDFDTNMECKIGILRQFNRRNEYKRKRSHKKTM